MKKIAVFTMLIVITLCCAFAFTACGKDELTLVMDKRYIFENDAKKDADKQASFIFHSNGTGEYTIHDDYYDIHEHYVIHFKYTYADSDKSAVVCFYDSITRLDGDDGSSHTKWSRLVTISKNVLVTSASDYWINEDYLKTIPNFHA